MIIVTNIYIPPGEGNLRRKEDTMGIFDAVNKKRTVMEGIETEDMDFVKLKDFAGQKVATKGFFFTNGKYGKSVVVVTDSVLINMPNWSVERFETIAADQQMLDAVLAGKMGLDNIRIEKSKNGNDTTKFDIVEI